MQSRSSTQSSSRAPVPQHRATPDPPIDKHTISNQLDMALAPIRDSLEAILRRLDDAKPVKSHLTVAEFASSVGRSEYRVRAWIKLGRIKATKVNGVGPKSRWLIHESELRRLLGMEMTVGESN